MNQGTILPAPFSSPLYLMAKPVGAACNLACDYCYYLGKSELYPADGRRQMTDATLELFIKSYIDAQSSPAVQFTWHGGEPLLRNAAFYRRVVELQRRYTGGRRIDNCLQTNGTLLTDEMCRFLRDEGWLVGISIDGPQQFHDEYRRTRRGGPTFLKVMQGIRMLQRYGVEWNAMAVVNDFNVGHPEEFYDFFKSIGCRYLQFTPIVERLTADGRLASATDEGEVTEMSVNPRRWGEFLCRVFDRWVRSDVGTVFVQLFDATLANLVGVEPGVCSMGRTCGHAGVVEHNGDVYSCDHFVFPAYRLGNIHNESVVEMMTSERQRQFGAAKLESLPGQCRHCPWLRLCNGECPKNRFVRTADGESGLNYLCEGYRMYFSHAAPYFNFMASELAAGRAPANVMAMAADRAAKGK